MNSIKDRAQAQISAQPRTVRQIAAIVTRSTTATESEIFPFDAIAPFADRAEGMRDGSGSRGMFPSWHQGSAGQGTAGRGNEARKRLAWHVPLVAPVIGRERKRGAASPVCALKTRGKIVSSGKD